MLDRLHGNDTKGDQTMKRKAQDCPEEQHGPVYNVTGAGLASYRKASTRSREHGAAVELAVIAMQRRELIREACEPETRPNCASGCWDEYPAEAIRRQQQSALLGCGAKERAARSDTDLEMMYCEHMRAQCGQEWIAPWQRPVETVELEKAAA
jgi:hypothetical protein